MEWNFHVRNYNMWNERNVFGCCNRCRHFGESTQRHKSRQQCDLQLCRDATPSLLCLCECWLISSLSLSANWFENYEFYSLQERKRRMFHISKRKLAFAETETIHFFFILLKCQWGIHFVSSIISHFSFVFRIPHGNRTFLLLKYEFSSSMRPQMPQSTERQKCNFLIILQIFHFNRIHVYTLFACWYLSSSHQPWAMTIVAQNVG